MVDLGLGRPTVGTPPHPDWNCKPELVVTLQMEIRQLEASTAAMHDAVLHPTRVAVATMAVVLALCFRGPARRGGGTARCGRHSSKQATTTGEGVAVSGKAAREVLNPMKKIVKNRVLYIYIL